MKTLICYKSKYGATKQYTEWLAQEVKADLLTFDDVKNDTFESYDTIIVSSGTYMGLMPLNRFLKGKWQKLTGKNVVVVAVGAAPANDNWSQWSYNRIPAKIRSAVKYFKLMGEDPEKARPNNYVSKVKKENLAPVIEYIKDIK